MTPMNTEMVDSPQEYTPEYCLAIRSACAGKIDQVDQKIIKVDEKVEKVDGRMFNLLLLGIGNLLTALGGLLAMALTR